MINEINACKGLAGLIGLRNEESDIGAGVGSINPLGRLHIPCTCSHPHGSSESNEDSSAN